MTAARRRPATVRRLERATGSLATAAAQRMDDTLPWYAAMPAEDRSWVNLVAQAGVAAFVEWFRDPAMPSAVTADIFGTAPRELVRAVSLQQTVDLIRTAIAVVEEKVEELAAPGEVDLLREAILLYSREVAFAAAQVYAKAAEARGAWDARLESLVLDGVLRGDLPGGDHSGDAVESRAAALGWGNVSDVCVIVGTAPAGDPEHVVETVKRAARHRRLEVLTGVQSDRLVVVLGGAPDAMAAARTMLGQFAPGPVVVGPTVATLSGAARSARQAFAGLRAVVAWPDAPRPVAAEDLLPERALDGDSSARKQLVSNVFRALTEADPVLLDTLAAYLERVGSLEGTARELFVHPNTVRYRLRRITDVTGLVPTDPRDAWSLRLALSMGRLDARPGTADDDAQL